MRLGSLFSGYGGLDRAAEQVFDATTVWHAETHRPAAAVLARHWPQVPNLGDVTHVDWANVQPVDVLVGGFPCQDVSVGGHIRGKRVGIAAGTRSGLWTAMAEAINTLRPAWVVAENVRGLLSARASVRAMGPLQGLDDDNQQQRALGAVLGDLADLGYDTRWLCLPAAHAGACHRRERVFILAHPAAQPGQAAADTDRERRQRRRGDRQMAGPPSPTQGQLRHAAVDLDPLPARVRRRHLRWGDYAPAIARWEHVTGRTHPEPIEPNSNGNGRVRTVFLEWMMGLPAGWVTDTPGVSRHAAVRLLGNGVVPQQAALALRLLLGPDTGPEAAS